MCQNITTNSAAVFPNTISDYFNKVERQLKDVPPQNMLNCDEANLSDDSEKNRIIAKRRYKYPETLMISTKSSILVMFATACDNSSNLDANNLHDLNSSLHLASKTNSSSEDGEEEKCQSEAKELKSEHQAVSH
ncbi:hypothetical protein ILUMI_11144 [Ignelater luminosus]|uniref:Uncharacterized protein n=1 Tax=Ignelater luminosus TaxID=2038154 RepID=A0A8K0CWS7_IGNLU|nr:hypothetical protein ILUMI_11144 [Ignelater luminosus]